MQMKSRIHTPSYDKNEWLINCDIPENVDNKYWKLSDDEQSIVEMTDGEKVIVDKNIADKLIIEEAQSFLESTDHKMARVGEEVVDNIESGTEISQYTKDLIADRKAKRELLS